MSQDSNQVVEGLKAQAEAPAESRNFESVTNKILELRQDNGAWQQNIADINEKVDMKTLGFPDDFRILDVQKDGKLLTVSEDGSKIQLRDAKGLAVEEQRTSPPYNPKEGDFVSKNGVEGKSTDRIPFESAFKEGAEPKQEPAEPKQEPETKKEPSDENPAAPKKEVWGSKGREFSVNPDGSADYVAKKGDNYWSVASDVAAQRLGRKIDINNPEDVGKVNGVVNELAALNNKEIKDGKIALEPNETIKVPAPKANESNPDANKTEWGSHGRKFDVKEDGSAEYSAKGGDNYWSVARDVVEKRLGHKVDTQNAAEMTQVNEMTSELAKFNGKTIVNGKVDLGVGETIKIPPNEAQKTQAENPPEQPPKKEEVPANQEPKKETPGQPDQPTEEQKPVEEQKPTEQPTEQQKPAEQQRPSDQTRTQTTGFKAQGGLYNPVEPVGFEGTPGEQWTQPRASEGNQTVNYRRPFKEPVRGGDGHTTHTYIGSVEAGQQDNRFKAAEERGANGELIARRVQYEHGMKMKFQVQPGQQMELNVKEMRTRVDGAGNYQTEIQTADGKYFVAQTQANGQSRFLTAAEVRAQRGS